MHLKKHEATYLPLITYTYKLVLISSSLVVSERGY